MKTIVKGRTLHLNQQFRYVTRNAPTRDCQVAVRVLSRCREAGVPLRHDIVLATLRHDKRRQCICVSNGCCKHCGALFDDCCENVSSMVSAGMLLIFDARSGRGRRIPLKPWRRCLFAPQASILSLFYHSFEVHQHARCADIRLSSMRPLRREVTVLGVLIDIAGSHSLC